ncbi:hypothetical protein RN2511_012170 [Rhodococcus sp. NKCM2511]|nr:hypothetical protein RN2511_012170 [Rhodococcus sp. NKCM2511]
MTAAMGATAATTKKMMAPTPNVPGRNPDRSEEPDWGAAFDEKGGVVDIGHLRGGRWSRIE